MCGRKYVHISVTVCVMGVCVCYGCLCVHCVRYGCLCVHCVHYVSVFRCMCMHVCSDS